MKRQKMAALITCILVVGLAGVWHCVVQKSQVKESIKVGFVYIGDESNPYVYNFIRAKNYKMKCERYLNKSAFRTFFYFKQ